jgi:glycosyltransferase involved in cell wall biosynthesis
MGLVYHGVDIEREENVLPPPVLEMSDTRFVFTAGSIRPARGLEDLISAVAGMGDGFRVVVAGNVDPRMGPYREQLESLAARAGVSRQLLWAGSLSPSEMDWCYRNAAAFVMTTRTEACPNIALEAMANGAVTVSTDDPPMPEMFGDTALFYHARHPDSLARSLETVLSMAEDERRASSVRALARARQFDWDRCASRTLEELRIAADSPPTR